MSRPAQLLPAWTRPGSDQMQPFVYAVFPSVISIRLIYLCTSRHTHLLYD